MKTPVADPSHPGFKSIQVVDALGLDEVDAGLYLFGQPGDAKLKGIREIVSN